jgi:preprotein translocase subunit SecE
MAKPQAARPMGGDRTQAARPAGETKAMTKPRTGPFDFLSQVRAEGEKVTWPSRKETLITAAMVFVMVIVASAFFLFVDFVLQKAVGLVLGLAG